MKYVSTKEAARSLGLTESELRHGFKIGKYPGLRVGEKGSKFRFCVEQIAEYLAATTDPRSQTRNVSGMTNEWKWENNKFRKI